MSVFDRVHDFKQLQAVVLLLTGCARTCGTYFTTAVPTHKITMWQLKISYFYHFLGGGQWVHLTVLTLRAAMVF